MSAGRPALVCTGVALDRAGQPVGVPCGTRAHAPCEACGAADHDDQVLSAARDHGWKIGPAGPDGSRPAMCPACGRADRRTLAALAALGAPTGATYEPAPLIGGQTEIPGL